MPIHIIIWLHLGLFMCMAWVHEWNIWVHINITIFSRLRFKLVTFSALFRSPRWHGSWTHNECGSCEFELHTGYWSCLEIGIFCSNSMVRNFRHSLPQRSGTSWNFFLDKSSERPLFRLAGSNILVHCVTLSLGLRKYNFSNTWRLGRI